MAVSPGLIARFGESDIGAGFKEDVETRQAAEAKAKTQAVADRAEGLSTLLRHGDLDDTSFDSVLNEFIGTIPSIPGSPQFDPSTISSQREEFSAWLESLDTLKKKGANAEVISEAFDLGKRRFGGRAGFAAATAGTAGAIKAAGVEEEATRAAAVRTGIPAIETAKQGTDVAAALEAGRLPKEAAKVRTEAQRLTRESPKAIVKKRIAIFREFTGRDPNDEETRRMAIQDPFGTLDTFEDEDIIPEDLPNPKSFKGKTIKDPDTGKSFRSDGSEWTEI